MKISTMRFFDSYIGSLICFFLSFFNPIRELFSNRAEITPKRILVIKLFGMGTILLASPSLRLIKEKYPHAKIILLTFPQNKELCKKLHSIDRVICLRVGNIFVFPFNLLKLIINIWKLKCSIIIDFEFFSNFTAILTFFTLIPYTVGFATFKISRNKFYKRYVSFDHSRHVSKIFYKFAQAIVGDTQAGFNFEKECRSLLEGIESIDVQHWIGDLKDKEFFICININASELCLHRRWPIIYYKEVIEHLLQNKQYKIILIGGENDILYVNKLLKLLPSNSNLINLCGKINITQLIAILNKCRLFITNDSGPLHIAEVLDIPTISFFGPETPYLYGPQGKKHYIFYRDLYCSPCINVYNAKESSCERNECLISITPKEVIKVIKERYLRKYLDEEVVIKA